MAYPLSQIPQGLRHGMTWRCWSCLNEIVYTAHSTTSTPFWARGYLENVSQYDDLGGTHGEGVDWSLWDMYVIARDEGGYLNFPLCRACARPGAHSNLRCRFCGIVYISETPQCPVCSVDVPCGDCGKSWKRETLTHIKIHGRSLSVCSLCLKENYSTCFNCGLVFAQEDAVIIQTQQGNRSTPQTLCEVCAEHSYRYCKKCNVWTLRTSEIVPGVFEYNHKPEPKFLGVTDRQLYFGLEIEVETCLSRHRAARDAVKLIKDFAYLKRDSSLLHGFEIVTEPIAFMNLRQYLTEERLDLLNSFVHADEEPTCGLHVHLSRRSFTAEHLYNFLYFHYANLDFMRIVAGRDAGVPIAGTDSRGNPNRAQAPFIPMTLAKLDRLAKGEELPRDRHVAINLQPQQTVEIRYFASTLDFTLLHARLQFLHALHTYTARRSKLGNIRVNPLAFGRFVMHHAGKYPELMLKLPDWLGELEHAPRASAVKVLHQNAVLVRDESDERATPTPTRAARARAVPGVAQQSARSLRGLLFPESVASITPLQHIQPADAEPEQRINTNIAAIEQRIVQQYSDEQPREQSDYRSPWDLTWDEAAQRVRFIGDPGNAAQPSSNLTASSSANVNAIGVQQSADTSTPRVRR